ncbi:hypothetical protein [Salirhabdus sp. Marseille-P4669]|uniref:hypothetical protein n=1 Tax=Salirhabdus sp. Marseille-P4669 TaxID=2042310 RepID=UPI000C7CEA9D|nr:hypothetical protein [Salirhabdus sp. Marseille-P4669]
MINLLKRNLGSDFYVHEDIEEEQYKIRVYRKTKNDISQDVYVELQYNEEQSNYQLLLMERDKEFSRGSFMTKSDGVFALALYAEAILGSEKYDLQTQRQILKIDPQDTSLLSNLISSKVGSQYFSIFQNKRKVINLARVTGENDLYNIFYLTPNLEKVNLVSNREAPSAFLVLYNFSEDLKNFTELCNKWKVDVQPDMNTEERVRRLFLGK